MKTALLAISLSASLMSLPAFGQPAQSPDEHSTHHPQIAQTQTQAPSQGPARMPGMMGGSGQQGPGGMMGSGMMSRGMMGAMPMMGMHGPMMKIMLAIADVNGDGGLSFEEVTTLHKRVFDAVDANKDGKVTREEMQAFFQE